MTKDQKWLVVLLGFAISLFLGWVIPFIWPLYLIAVVVVLITPTKTKPQPNGVVPQSVETKNNTPSTISQIESQLQEKARTARNDDVREGIMSALETVRQYMSVTPASSAYNPLAQAQPVPVVAQLSPDEIARQNALEKERQEQRNINTILYIACFLLVGAAALFIGLNTGISETFKFSALLFIAVVFYVVGLVIHQRSARLRPAAVAFVGTGLALLPFVGLAFYNYMYASAELSWWLTSLLGLLGFWFALLRIRAQVMSYLTIAFVFSLTASSVSVLSVPFVWYFVVLILMSSLMSYLSYKKPSWLPAELYIPMEQNAQLAVPVVLAGSLLTAQKLSAMDYALISAVGSLHYGFASLQAIQEKTKYMYWSLARALAIIFAMSLTYSLTNDWRWVGLTLMVGALLTHVYAVSKVMTSPREIGWLWFSQVAIVFSALLWIEDLWSLSAGLGVVVIISLHQLLIMKRAEYSTIGILAIMTLILTVGRGSIVPAVSFEVLALVALVLSVGMFVLRSILSSEHPAYRTSSSVAYTLLAVESLILSAMNGDQQWIASVSCAVAVLFFVASFVERQPWFHVPSNILALIGTVLFYVVSDLNSAWVPLAVGWTTAIIWYGLRWYYAQTAVSSPDSRLRGEIMLGFSISALLLSAYISAATHEQTVIASALTGCVGAAMVAVEGYYRKDSRLYEIALVILTISLQRLTAWAYPSANILIYTHWWAAVIALVAWFRLQNGDRESAKIRGVLALTVLSVPTGFYALNDPDAYQLLFLLEHVVLLIAGTALNKKLVVRWSAVAIILALVWLLKGYTYILLTALALGLIALAIWRLLRK